MGNLKFRLDAVILASGLSRRMGTNKLLLPLGNSNIIGQFLARFPYTFFDETLVVVADKEVAAIAATHPVTLLYNEHPEAGKSHSIRLGLTGGNNENGVLFTVADQPLITVATIEKLVDVFRDNPEHIVMPKVKGVPANPVLFPADLRDELAELQGDNGGRQLIEQYPERVYTVPFASDKEFYDIDTPEKYQELVKQWKQEN